MTLGPSDVAAFERCIAGGGVAVFPADTVYGLACDPESPAAVARLYELKGRPADKPAAVMFFALERALAALPELAPRTRAALGRLLPGALTVLVENPLRRFPHAAPPTAPDAPPSLLGLRVPAGTALDGARVAVLQSSANLAGEADARTLADVPAAIRDGADLVLDGGALPGTPSTVVSLLGYEDAGTWSVLRAGAVDAAVVGRALGVRA